VVICDSIVNDLLEFTRGRHSHTLEGEINPWLEHILEKISETQQVKIEKTFSDNLPRINFDQERIRRVVVNLMHNAYQAISERKLRETVETYQPAIKVSSKVTDADVTIIVADNGIGMDAETREKAFEPLFTTRARGTGLGLANVRKIIEEHGGTVMFESEPNEGTRAILAIPAAVKK
jgi:signal transduction histidine kinase